MKGLCSAFIFGFTTYFSKKALDNSSISPHNLYNHCGAVSGQQRKATSTDIPFGQDGGNATADPMGAENGGASAGSAESNSGGVQPAAASNKHFYMSAKLDNTRVNRDVQNYLQEIIQHLTAVDGSHVELTLEVEVTAPDGIPSTTVRTVSENCRTLKVTDFGFDD